MVDAGRVIVYGMLMYSMFTTGVRFHFVLKKQ